MNQKKYYPTAVALYVTYFILGIAVTIMGQYKQSFAAMWGANQLADGSFDVSKVMAIIAAVGLGRLIAFPFAGPFSDKYGRRLSALDWRCDSLPSSLSALPLPQTQHLHISL